MQYIFTLGGWDGVECRSDVAIYSPDGAPSTHLAQNARSMLSPRDGMASVFVDGDVLALGGTDGSNYLASCEAYSPSSPRFPVWTNLAAMGTSRAFHAAAAERDKVYVLGGQGSQTGPVGAYGDPHAKSRQAQALATCEVLDLERGEWCVIGDMPSVRTMHAGATAAGRVLAIGGREGKFEQGQALSSVVALDPRDGKWREVAPMAEQRFGCAATTCDGVVYVFGGKGTAFPLATAEIYDPRADKWESIEPMRNERVFPCAAAMGAFVYVLCGFNRTNEVHDVEEWSHATRRWRTSNFKLHVDQQSIEDQRTAIQDAEDKVYLLEFDYNMAEAERIRKTMLPLLRTRLDLAAEGRLHLWKGGLPQTDSLLGTRHLSAQTIIPPATLEFLKQRERDREEEANQPPPGAEAKTKS
ncbi:hypothetical protein T484DRAFT_1955991 [Baffinella frigidus]|nr:hypothetical protein T484DRAFT_1955991 [Cryptophyta sp. CCMP2293]